MSEDRSDPSRNMRDRAIALVRQGFSVFPLAAGTKNKPVVPWGTVPKGEYFDRIPSKDENTIYSYWTGRDGTPLNYNIAICANDLLVFDVDNKNGKNGEMAWQQIRNDYKLLSTLESRTPTGGRHLFYKLPEGHGRARNTVSLLGEGVDTRGWHGYVVAPGSIVAAGEYQWSYETPGTWPMAVVPEAILQRCGQRRSKANGKTPTTVEGVELDTTDKIDRAAQWLLHDAPDAVENEAGDYTTYKVAVAVKDIGISEYMCLELLDTHWNWDKAYPPWSIEELEQKVANAYAYGTEPIGVRAAEAQFQAVPVENEGNTGPTDNDKVSQKPRLFWRGYNEARRRYLTGMTSPLIANYLGKGEMSVMYGDSNTGKTFVALDFAYHVATASAWNGNKVYGGLVVYVAAEAGESINVRLEALHRRYQPGIEPPIATVPCLVDLSSPRADLGPLLRLLEEISTVYGVPISFIILDTLARVIGPGDENSAKDMGLLVRSVDRIRVNTGAHVELVHHSGKNKANGARGSSALRAATDTEIEIEGNRIFVRKQRNGEQAKPIPFRLVPVNLGKNKEGESVTSCTVEIGATVDFGPHVTNEQQEWIDQLRAVTTMLPDGFTRKDMQLAWPDVTERTAQRRAEALVSTNILSVVEGREFVYWWMPT
jgi:AAA domain/Bifunctional DNA primase/polymerase, N-terminal